MADARRRTPKPSTKPRAPLAADLYASVDAGKRTKGERRRRALIESVITIVAEDGIDALTFDGLARHAGVSRALVFHYFPDRDALLSGAFELVREDYQRTAIAALKDAEGLADRLTPFVAANFAWLDARPAYARLWGHYLVACGINPSFRALNTELASIGVRRVTAILEAGKHAGVYQTPDPVAAAKQIQSALVGAMFTLVTEDHARGGKAFRAAFMAACRHIADGPY